jgi:putative transposase
MRRSRLKILHQTACYHIVCRITQQQPWLEAKEKIYLSTLLPRVAHYCGVEVLTFCIMSNHFHLLVRIPKKVEADAKLGPGHIVQRVSELYGTAAAGHLKELLGATTRAEGASQLGTELAIHLGRMHDLSIFMKLLKQRFTMWHNRQHDSRGTLWTERFKSVLVESRDSGRDPLQLVAAYIDLNPVRAGLVADAKEYPYSGYGSAASGHSESLRGLMALTRVSNAAAALSAYQALLEGNFPAADESTEPANLATALRSRQAAFVKGAVLGSAAFVMEIFNAMIEIRRSVRPQSYATGGLGGSLWVGQRYRRDRANA